MEDTTLSQAIQPFLKYAFPLIRMVLPQLATEKLFNIQMMFGYTSMLYFFEYLYGTTVNRAVAGNPLFDTHDPYYGASKVEFEVNGVVAPGSPTTIGAASSITLTNLTEGYGLHVPVVKTGIEINFVADIGSGPQEFVAIENGTFVGTKIGVQVKDPSTGALLNILDNSTINDSFIDISTGEWQLKLDLVSNPGAFFISGENVAFTYSVANEAPDLNKDPKAIPEIELKLSNKQVNAISRKIRFRWSFETQFALKDQFGLVAESEFLNAAASEIGYGIDSANINEVRRVATDVRGNANYQFPTIPGGVSLQEHVQGLPVYLGKVSNRILTDTGRGLGNKIVAGEAVINLIMSIGAPRFVAVPMTPSRGIFKVGDLDNRWEVFWDVRMPRTEYIMLFKSNEFLRAAFVWAPWIVAFTTPTSVLDDFQGRKGVGTLYGKHVVNAKMFVLADVNSSF
jgi:hypothetical protein